MEMFIAFFVTSLQGKFMKNPSKMFTLSSKVLLSGVLSLGVLFLSACGGDKATEPAPSTEPTKTATSDKPAPQADTNIADPKPADSQAPDTKPDETPQTNQAPQSSPDKATPVKALSLEEGKARYEKTCKICHEQGLLDAPKLTATADWAKRLEKGVDTLHVHSAKGFNKMPAQATGDVSEAEVYAAVDYMISQVKK